MFHILSEDLEDLKKRRNEKYMFHVLKQAAQLKQSQFQEFKVPQFETLLFFSRLILLILSIQA